MQWKPAGTLPITYQECNHQLKREEEKKVWERHPPRRGEVLTELRERDSRQMERSSITGGKGKKRRKTGIHDSGEARDVKRGRNRAERVVLRG